MLDHGTSVFMAGCFFLSYLYCSYLNNLNLIQPVKEEEISKGNLLVTQ